MKNLDELKEKYKRNGCLIFKKTDNLRKLSKEIPEGLCGIYIFAMQEKIKERILYIGCSGHIEEGKPISRKKHGLRGRIYGKQEKIPRDEFYKKVMTDNNVSELKIYWFDTEQDDPEFVEYESILCHIVMNGEFPVFNNKLERKYNKAKK